MAPHAVISAEPPVEVVDIKGTIKEAALKHGVSYPILLKTLDCESDGFKDVAIQSGFYKKDGTRENSWGIAQLNLDVWKNVTKEQAIDPVFAANFAAEQFKEGHANLWVCYNMIHEKSI